MTAPPAAATQYAQRKQIAQAAVNAATTIWNQLDPNNVSASWQTQKAGDQLFLTLSNAQNLAASSADFYTDAILAEQGSAVGSTYRVNSFSVAGVASDGRDLESLLLEPVITAAVARSAGVPSDIAMGSGLSSLTRIFSTQVADAGRAASSMSIATRPAVSGYIRVVEPSACGRCIVLAGKFYRYSSGFLRHPNCHCVNVPAGSGAASLARSSRDLFESMTEEQQNQAFTRDGAQAIRDGGNISQVVNANRRALGLSSPGTLTARQLASIPRDSSGAPLLTTREGTSSRGFAYLRLQGQEVRLMPAAIYQIAGSRQEAVRLLYRYGYIV